MPVCNDLLPLFQRGLGGFSVEHETYYVDKTPAQERKLYAWLKLDSVPHV